MKQSRHDPQPHIKVHINAQSLTCIRDEHQVFTDINFSLHAGEALFLRGPNGSGKSSLLMILAGLLPHKGNLEFGRTAAQQENLPTSHLIHFIGHLNAIKLELTLTENLKFWIDLSGGNASLIPEVLENAGLSGLNNFAAGHLSAGQKHRLSLARLLVSPRPVWLLDEPSSALDAAGDKWIVSLIENHLEKRGLVIAATHRAIELTKEFPVKTLTLGAAS